ncbi:MAG: OstA-like protein [Thermaurantimonas sp.]
MFGVLYINPYRPSWCTKFYLPAILVMVFYSHLNGQSPRLIRILNSDRATGSRDVSYLSGNVIFEHEGARMRCDSAVRYLAKNFIQTFGNIHLNQGDSISMTAKAMEYNGNTRIAKARGDVVLKDSEMTLHTQAIDFNRNKQTAYYTTVGTIINNENTLTSMIGMYHFGAKMFSFKKDVRLSNPRYRMECDTLQYFTISRVAHFDGPTHIYSDSGYIYCENGRYNTISDEAMFNRNAIVRQKNIEMRGDSLYYNQRENYGKSFGNIQLTDTLEKFSVFGDLGEYSGLNDERMYVTGSSLFINFSEADTLFVLGDTIRTIRHRATDQREVFVYRNALLYKSNLQGKADSLHYSTSASTFHLTGNPVLWSDTTQITGRLIVLTLKNNEPDSIFVYENAFILSIESDTFYNQIKGRDLEGNFIDKKLSQIFIKGNGQTVYYVKEDDGTFVGISRADCSNLLINFSENKVKEIKFITKPEARLIPLGKENDEDIRLKNLTVRFDEKPEVEIFKKLIRTP